jgi:hypothetical protein
MTNRKLVKSLLKKVETLRQEIIDTSFEVQDEKNYDLVFDTLSTEVESDLCNLIDTFKLLIDDIDDMK